MPCMRRGKRGRRQCDDKRRDEWPNGTRISSVEDGVVEGQADAKREKRNSEREERGSPASMVEFELACNQAGTRGPGHENSQAEDSPSLCAHWRKKARRVEPYPEVGSERT